MDLGVKIRHIKNLPSMSFAIGKEFHVTMEYTEESGNMVKNLLFSNEHIYLKHFICTFEELWKNGIDARDRIRDIEQGVDLADIEIIQNPEESIKLAYNLIKSAKEEVLRIFSSINAFRRQARMGIMHLFKEVLEQGVKVRLLIPADEQQITQIVNEVNLTFPQIYIRAIDKNLQTRIGIVVIDKKESLIIETKDDTKDNSYDASGLAAYSNSKPISLSYASIFESLWKQAELYEQLKVHDKMQKEFINVAAHELRTPIQPILG